MAAHSTPARSRTGVGSLTMWAVALGVVVLAGCGGGTVGAAKVPRAPFWPARVQARAPVRDLLHTRLAPGAPGKHRYEYVFPDRHIDVYDIDQGFRLVASWLVPEAQGFRGIAVSPATAMLYLSVGGNGGASGTGKLIAYDLRTNRIRWERAFPTGTDSPAITPDGRRLYLPTGERSNDNVWYVIAARTGEVTAEIHAGPGPHNTIVAPDGHRVYLGPRNSRFLYVAATATGRIVRRIGPLKPGVRPFTINGAQTLAFTTATGFLGFQVSSIRTGKVLDTVPVRGFSWHHSLGTPSHGISLSPDSRELYLLDVPNSYVHVYDVAGLPGRVPRQIANIAVTSMKGLESPCGGDCGRAGWLQHSLEGRYVFVGDAGDVIDTRTRHVVAVLPGLRNSRYQFELDWRGGQPVATSTRSGIGRPVTAR